MRNGLPVVPEKPLWACGIERVMSTEIELFCNLMMQGDDEMSAEKESPVHYAAKQKREGCF